MTNWINRPKYFPVLKWLFNIYLCVYSAILYLKMMQLHRNIQECVFITMMQQPPIRPRPPNYQGFTITLRHITVGRTPLNEWSAQRRELYLTTRNNHNRQTSIPPVGFEPAIPANERPQTHALDRAATGIGCRSTYDIKIHGWYI